jgi:hypothetical protein
LPHLLILVHRHDSFERERYVLREMTEVWREIGINVTVVHGPRSSIPADLAILHVDLTVTPPEYLALAERYPSALNAKVIDISKRVISRHLVRRGDGFDGPVIVKTDRNSGGMREARLCAKTGSRPARLFQRLRDRLPWHCRGQMPTDGYRVFDSPRHVPMAVWFNPAFVVERFLPERSGDLFCLRTWVFFGNRQTHSRSFASEPIIKSGNVVRREVLGEVPEELQRVRRDMGFDFGKFDYGIVDGRVIVYDVNRTPMFGAISREDAMPRVKLLAEGLRGFLHE